MILEQTKILTNRYSPQYFSMDLDDRGFPHLAWVEEKNGYYDLVYKFWNGFCWESLETDVIYTTDSEITYSNIIAINNEINIVFIKKNTNNSTVGFVKINQVIQEIVEYQANDFINWVGITKDRTENERVYLITHEGASFKIYRFNDDGLTLESTTSYDLTTFDKIKIGNTPNNLVIANNETTSIKFNFYNYSTNTWANANFVELSLSTVGDVSSYDIEGLSDSEKIGMTFLSHASGEKVYYVESDSSGTET